MEIKYKVTRIAERNCHLYEIESNLYVSAVDVKYILKVENIYQLNLRGKKVVYKEYAQHWTPRGNSEMRSNKEYHKTVVRHQTSEKLVFNLLDVYKKLKISRQDKSLKEIKLKAVKQLLESSKEC